MLDLLSLGQSQTNVLLTDRLHDSLNYFLTEISGKIQLTPTQREKAVGHYEAIANVLKNSPENTLLSKLDVKMIPFGGLGTNTASKPFKDDEFDLDLIVRFFTTIHTFGSAEKLYNEVYKALKTNEVYRDKLELKDRCVRIYYSGEFHLDLMPAVLLFPNDSSSTKLHIAEKQKNGLFELEMVDPIGLMDWFEKKCNLQAVTDSIKNLSERGDFEFMPLTSSDARKSALKQAVQLMKRARDVYFTNDDDCKKILKSVVILTVGGEVYSGEKNIYSIVDKIIKRIDELTFWPLFMSLKNPVNDSENFLESLGSHADRYEKLRQFISMFKKSWADLANPNISLEARSRLLSKLFGERVTNNVLEEYSERVQKANLAGQTRMVSSGLIGLSESNQFQKVPRHQFYGDK